jgi:tight adherence protein C
MGIAVFAFLIVFLLIASGGVLLFYREQMIQRLTSVISPETKKATLMNTIQQSGFSLSSVVEHLERVIPKSQAEVGVTQQRLIRAGYRSESATNVFYGAKVLVPLAFCGALFVSGFGHDNPFVMFICALGLGFLAPDFWLGRQIKKRQAKLRRALPDVLDLLVICIEAGLSLDQATKRTTEELKMAQPALCDELNIVVLEQRAGRPRADCWKHLAERTDVDSLRNLVSVLIQAEQFGTSIAKTLRTHSDTLRTQRMQKVEEMAAKTTVKLVFPLVLFIFPSLFLVVLGPAFITMSESFKTFFNQ